MVSDLLSGRKANVDGLVPYLGMSSMREGLDLSQEQIQKIQQEVQRNLYPILENDPNFLSLRDEARKFDPDSPAATEETLKRYADLQVEMDNMVAQKRVNLIYENLTPDQNKKVYEYHISNMDATGYVFPGMFEALDLSGEQKQQLDKIQKEMKPELEKHIDRKFELQDKEYNMIQERRKGMTPPQVRDMIQPEDEAWGDVVLKVRAELQPERDRIMESGRKLADELKIKMFDVLTDEQWARMIDLIDNPPDHVKKMVAAIRKVRGDDDNKPDANKPGVWMPGPNTWRPGDPIPEQYRQQRQEQQRTRQRAGFPRTENP
jgi:hypothetical protein